MNDPEDLERSLRLIDELSTCSPDLVEGLKSLVADGLVTFQVEMVEAPGTGRTRLQLRYFTVEHDPDQRSS